MSLANLQKQTFILSGQVASLQGQVGTNTTDIASLQNPSCGRWYKTDQTINTYGAPSYVSINWNNSSSWTDTTISQNTPNGAIFNVNVNGIYRLDFQILYNNINLATFTDRSILARIMVTRGGNSIILSQSNFDVFNNNPTNVAISTGGLFELNIGDDVFFQSVQFLSAGSLLVLGQDPVPTQFDLNTFWTFQLVKNT